jgi:hypothetical protein
MISVHLGLLDQLPESIPEPVRQEVVGIAGRLSAGASCLVTGSLVEGIGNNHSDVDFYVIHPDDVRGRPTEIGIRGSRYVDCEHLTVEAVAALADRVADPSAQSLLQLQQRDLDRYYRLGIGVRLLVTDRAAGVLDRCEPPLARQRLAEWSALLAYQHLGRAAVTAAVGQLPQARALLREAALWRATSVLATAGEGYPALKWAEVKAARRFGRGSPEYLDCLDGYLVPDEDPVAWCARLGERITPPSAVRDLLASRQWRLAESVTLVADGSEQLVLNRSSVARPTGVVALIVSALHDGAPWLDAVTRAAERLGVAVDLVVAASYADLRGLSEAGFLTSPEGGRT